MISVAGAYDLHVHSAPCLYPRLADDLTISREASAAGLKGLVIKSHHEPTAGRAAVVNAALGDSEFTTFGSITLNYSVGGINPAAVEAALKTNARIVWLPTVDSQAHYQAFGHTGGWDVQNSIDEHKPRQPLSILDRNQSLIPNVIEVVDLCREHGRALATGHCSRAEIEALVQCAEARNLERLIITHPLFRVPGYDASALTGLRRPNVYFEFTYCSLSPMWCHTTIDATIAAIRSIGITHAYLSSDGGQTHNPPPQEGLRLLAQMCAEKGLAENEIRQLIVDVPAFLVGAA